MSEIVARNGAIDLDRSAIDYDSVQDPGHGNTAAAWTGVFIILIGSVIATVANVMDSWTFFWAGVIVALAGPIIGLVMRAAGKGRPKKSGHRK